MWKLDSRLANPDFKLESKIVSLEFRRGKLRNLLQHIALLLRYGFLGRGFILTPAFSTRLVIQISLADIMASDVLIIMSEFQLT